MNDLIATIEQMQAEARDGMKRASRDSDPYLYQYLVGKFHAFGKVAGILKKQKEQKWLPSEGEMGVLYKLCYLSNQITDEDDTELTRLYQDLKREYFNGHSFENMFSNEKQKEPHYTKRNALFDKCVENCDPEIMKRVSDEVDEMLQKEQKPVQSDVEREYVRTLKSLISDFLRGKEDVDREYYQQIFDWLDGRHIEQKPVDFPTTDEEVNEFLETHSKVEVPEKYKTPDFVFSKQEYKSYPIISKDTTSVKPAEWSEEDEKKLEDVLYWFEIFCHKNQSKPEMQESLNWLKSLRPQGSKDSLQTHWKPSEVQMEALQRAIDACESEWAYQDDELRSLLNDLKKL